jgi:hypothetical protein
MSAVAVVILLLAALVILVRADVVTPSWPGPGFVRPAVWVVFGYLVLNTIMNLLSSSAGERFGMGAITLVTAALTFVVARSEPVN